MDFNALLSRAAVHKERQHRHFTYTLENGDTLNFVSIPEEQVFEEIDPFVTGAKERSLANILSVSDHLIYRCCPELQNPELHAQLGVAEPWDVVKEIFSISERNDMGYELLVFLEVNDLLSGAKNA